MAQPMPGAVAVVLTGGLGSRLRPLTTVIPKALLPSGDEPMLHRILDELQTARITRVVVVVASRVSFLVEDHLEALGGTISDRWPGLVITVHRSKPRTAPPCSLDFDPVAVLLSLDWVTSTTTLVAVGDELIPPRVTRRMVVAGNATAGPVVAIRDETSSLSAEPVHTNAVQEALDAETRALPRAPSRFVGRLVLTPEVWRAIEGDAAPPCKLYGLIARYQRAGGQVTGVRWPGPYLDIGDIESYRAGWQDWIFDIT
jgi:NDP-sugar pyrophosphorylase family protein